MSDRSPAALHRRPGAADATWPDEEPIDRRDTGLRILLTLLFGVVERVIQALLGIVVILGLLIALFTRRPPPPRLRAFANRVVTYSYRIGRYLTYNESRVPFPFSEFPEPIEPEAWRPDETESRALGIPELGEPDEDDETPILDDEDHLGRD